MLIGARTAAWSGKVLPYDREVKCIKVTTAGCCVDTGCVLTGNSYFSLDFIADNGNSLIGSYGVKLVRLTSRRTVVWASGSYNFDNLFFANRHNIKVGRQLFLDDSSDPVTTFQDVAFTETKSLFLFALHMQNDTAGDLGRGSIFGFKFWNDGETLTNDMFPVVKDNQGYFYDRISGVMLPMVVGTGAYTWEELDI